MSAPSSRSQARTEPPSASRAEEARAHGHVPRAELTGPAAALLVLALLLASDGPRLAHSLQSLLRSSLQAAALGPAASLEQQLSTATSVFGPMVAAALATCFVAMILARAVAQGGLSFSLRVFARRKHFDKVRSKRWLTGLIAAAVCTVVIGTALPETLRAEVSEVPGLLSAVAVRLAAAFVLLALIDAALARAAWWRSLWMTRRERSAEDREAYGSPELRAARARIRGQTQAQEPARSQDTP